MPSRPQRTNGVLTFLAENAATHTMLADLSKASCIHEVIAFADHLNAVTGHYPPC